MSSIYSIASLEAKVWEWTKPLNGQYPRPWMSAMTDPGNAVTFIVGRNQATSIPEDQLPDQAAFIDALFNRNGRTHAEEYAKTRARLNKGPSPTRLNVERLTRILEGHGVVGVLETNVICYSTPMSAGLVAEEHAGGAEAGQRIFRELLREVQPSVLIAHGSATRRDLRDVLGVTLPSLPDREDDGCSSMEVSLPGCASGIRSLVLVIPSLAPPGWNRWSRWATRHLEMTAERAASYVGAVVSSARPT